MAEEKSAMAEIARIINLSPDINDIYEAFAVELEKLVGFEWVLVNLVDHFEQTMTITYAAGQPVAQRTARNKFELAGTFTGAVMNEAVGLVMDVSQGEDPGRFPALAPYLEAGFCSFLGVKLVHHDQAMGVLNLISAKPGAYSECELDVAARAARQIAGAIANARLYAQQRESEAEIRDLAKFPSEDPNPVARISSRGKIIYANDAATNILENARLKAGKHTLGTWRESVANVLTSGSADEVEIDYGSRILSYSVVPVADAGYVNIYGRDITTAKEAERLKDEFISVASHELRTPVTSIKGFLELLEDERTGPVTMDQRRFLDAVGRNTRRLELLVDDLLDISRLDSSMIGLERSAFSVLEAFQQVVSEMQSEIEAKSLKVKFGDGLKTAVADADRDLVIQILANLLSNAIKYSPSGSPIYVDAKTNVDMASWLHVSIRDEGPGIDRSDAERLFEKFYRVDNSTTRDSQGTGLGLAITKALVDLHGGTIRVESKLGKGSSFLFTLPKATTVGVNTDYEDD